MTSCFPDISEGDELLQVTHHWLHHIVTYSLWKVYGLYVTMWWGRRHSVTVPWICILMYRTRYIGKLRYSFISRDHLTTWKQKQETLNHIMSIIRCICTPQLTHNSSRSFIHQHLTRRQIKSTNKLQHCLLIGRVDWKINVEKD